MVAAIETRYAGCRFRSRIEARWAVFFDTLGWDWEYERQSYRLGSLGGYLPDFWLSSCGDGIELWVEVKGAEPLPEALEKMAALVHLTNTTGVVLHGDIPRVDRGGWRQFEDLRSWYYLFPHKWRGFHGEPYGQAGGRSYSRVKWRACFDCGNVQLVPGDWWGRIPCWDCDEGGPPDGGHSWMESFMLVPEENMLAWACEGARSARFDGRN